MKRFIEFLQESKFTSESSRFVPDQWATLITEPLRAGTIQGYSSGPLRAGTIQGYSSGPLRAGTIQIAKTPTIPNLLATSTSKISKLSILKQVADVLDTSSPGAVATGAVVDLAKANWDAIKTTPAWAAEKMGQKIQTSDSASIGQLEDSAEQRKNTPSRYRK